MITVNKDWVITVDDKNYIVCKNKPMVDKKTGKVSYDAVAYYSNMRGALGYIIKQSGQNALIDKETDLQGAINIIQTTQEEIAEIIKKAIPDAETYFS